MKKSDLNKMLGLIDDDILKEAMPSTKKPKSRTSMWLKIVSAAACFLLVFNVILVPAAFLMNGKISSLTDELEGKNQIIENILEKEDSSEKAPTHVQNVIELPLGGNNKDTLLTSPLLSASSKYDDIIESMVNNSQYLPGMNDFDQDSENELEDALDKVEGESMENMGGESKYEETTDLQVKDVIEGDIIKRSSDYIYYLSGSRLKIYSIDKLNSELVALYSLDKHIEALNEALKIPEQPNSDRFQDLKEEILDPKNQVKEMFLSPSLKTVTVIIENRIDVENLNSDYMWDRMYGVNDALYCTSLISLNIENPSDVYLDSITTVFGRYESARLIDGEFLLFTEYVPVANELIIPQYNDGEGFKHIPRENIYSPEKYTSASYLISYKIQSESGNVSDVYAYASYNGEIYVTKNNIYITREYVDVNKIYGEYPIYANDEINDKTIDPNVILGYGKKTTTQRKTVTEILRVNINSGKFKPERSLTVDGYIKDRYSLHENGEYLYVVTTDGGAAIHTVYTDLNGKQRFGVDDISLDSKTSANIYVVDASVMVIAAKIERFAPSGETVRSVRFEGANAYVCTAKRVTDPVFFFDLSDPFAIKYSDTGTIPGFSTSLIELGNNELLGIGVDENGNVKIEAYKKGANNDVVIVDTYIINGSYSTDYKSHFIDRGNGYIGLGITDRKQDDSQRYVVLNYKNGYFTAVINCALNGTLDSKRAVYIDGYFYLFASNDFKVVEFN